MVKEQFKQKIYLINKIKLIKTKYTRSSVKKRKYLRW